MNFREPLSQEFIEITECAVVPDPEKKSSTIAFLSEAMTVFNKYVTSVVGFGWENTCAPKSCLISAFAASMSPTVSRGINVVGANGVVSNFRE